MSRPNILFLLTDQQRFDTLGALGNPSIRTPNLDRLAREGTAFTDAYTPSPVSVAARCSFTFGQYPFHTGCYDNGFTFPAGRVSFVQALAEAGYSTHGIGKCHFVPDGLYGFQARETQEEIVRDPAKDDYLRFLHEQGFKHVCDPHGIRGEMYYVPQPAQMPARLHPTSWVGERAAAHVESRAGRKEPWYLYASFIHPHPPFAPPNPWHKLYRAPLMPLPKVPRDPEVFWTHVNRSQNRYKYRDQGIDQNLMRNMRAYYYACISFIDFQVGRILETLERTGQLENTLIVFSSDHGEMLGDYNCFGKRTMLDGACRVPLLARLPGRFAAGGRCARPASLVDIAPTCLGAAGVDFGAHALDGVDLSALASGGAAREYVYSQYQRAGRGLYMACGERWKYIYSAADGREYLIDRREDPQETRDRAGVAFREEPLERMRAAMLETLRAAGEDAALDGAGWKAYPKLEMPANPDGGLLIQDHPWAETQLPGYTE
ncbi:MAG: sulfatase-like hydrolase/transferase [Planctomycetota bacterium]|nr:sulfatase-like hydrolase/transferase [Planctomycetota bacterium]